MAKKDRAHDRSTCLTLGHRDAHIWNIDLRPSDIDFAVLTDEDWERTQKILIEAERFRHLAARTALRRILSLYTGQAPEHLRFRTGPWGKPRISRCEDLHFNLSHSGDKAICAVACREVGVDVEQIRPLEHMMDIVRGYFSATESIAIGQFTRDAQVDAFFRCWTRKEAYLKACGLGLTVPLASFAVSLDDDNPRVLYSERGDQDTWLLKDIPVARGYTAALAIDSSAGTPGRFHFYKFGSTTERN